jgi:hypothetical protein
MVGNNSIPVLTDSQYYSIRDNIDYLGVNNVWTLGYKKAGVLTSVLAQTYKNHSRVNSFMGLNITVVSHTIGNINHQIFVTSILNTSFSFNNEDYLRFTCDNSESIGLSNGEKMIPYIIIGKKNISVANSLIIGLTEGSCNDLNSFEYPAVGSWASGLNCVDGVVLSSNNCDSGKETIDIKKENIVDALPYNDLSFIDNIERIDIYIFNYGSYNQGGLSFYIDDLTVYTPYNEMPVINSFTTDKNIYCYENNSKVVNVPININVSDNENDNILYSTKLNTNIETLKYISFRDTFCLFGFCDVQFKESSLNDFVYPYNTTCLINETPSLGVFYPINGYDETGSEYFFLNLNYYCNGNDKSIYYDMKKNTQFINNDLTFFEYDLLESFNITYYDELFNSQIVLIFDKNNSGTYVYTYYDNAKTLIKNIGLGTRFTTKLITKGNDKFDLYVYNSSSFSNLLLDSYNYLSYSLPRNNDNSIRYISVSIDNKSILYFRGGSYVYGESYPVFSYDKITNITLTETSNTIKIYVTDNYHNGNSEYIYTEKTLTILPCSQYVEINNSVDWKLAIKQTNRGLCGNIGKLVYLPNLCKYLTWIVIFITALLSFFVSGLFITIAPNLVWSFFLIMFSLENAFIGVFQFTEYTGAMNLFFIFCFAVGVATLFINIISANHGGGTSGV